METIKNICVFCGSSSGSSPLYKNAAVKLGEAFVENDLTLVYGGARVGLMGALADTVLRAGGKVIGVIPKFLTDKEIAHRGLDNLIVVETMHERKEKMCSAADAFIALPGGFGTIEEIFEMITWGQLNLHMKPCAFLNINGYYDKLIEFLDVTVREGFIHQEFRNMAFAETEPARILKRLFEYAHPVIDKAQLALK